jgi:hypothetical protein
VIIFTHVEDWTDGPGGRCQTVRTVPVATAGRSRWPLPDGPGGHCRTVLASASGRSWRPLPDGPGGRCRKVPAAVVRGPGHSMSELAGCFVYMRECRVTL